MVSEQLLTCTSCHGGPSLDFGTLMSADVAGVVVKHLASTQERMCLCRSVSKECRSLVDSQVHSLAANLASLTAHTGIGCPAGGSGLPLQLPCLRSLAFQRVPSSGSGGGGTDSSALLTLLAARQPALLAKLQTLDLSSCQGLEADALAAVLQACASLTTLTLPSLASCVHSSRQDFARALSTHGTGLQHLLGAGDYIDADTAALLARQLPRLTTLDLAPGGKQLLPLPPRALLDLSRLTGLTSLTLGSHVDLHAACELAASLPALSSLAFVPVDGGASWTPSSSNSNNAEEEEDSVAAALAPLRAAPALASLALAGLPCGARLLSVLGDLPQLRQLQLHACSPFRGGVCAAPATPARLAGRLTSLSLRVLAADAAAAAAALPALAGAGLARLSLRIHRVGGGDCAALLAAALVLPALQHLSLECHYTGFSEAEVADLPVAPHLSSLALRNHFDDASLAALTSACPNLTALQLSGCGEVTDAGLAALPVACPRLASLRLVMVRGVGAAGVAGLVAGAPPLRRLVLEGCRNVSAAECQQLAADLDRPGLDIIRLR